MKKKNRQFYVSVATDVGMCRKINEDNILVNEKLGLFLVADGVGGHGHGNLASKIVVDQINKKIEKNIPLEVALYQVNEDVKLEAKKKNHHGMASTVAALHIVNSTYEISWVGDSRVYGLKSNQRLKQITCDHSYSQELFNQKLILECEIENHPNKNLLTSALGINSQDDLQVGKIRGSILEYDYFLICSDGLYNALTITQIQESMENSNMSNKKKAQNMIDMANARGANDNVSVILVYFNPDVLVEYKTSINDITIKTKII